MQWRDEPDAAAALRPVAAYLAGHPGAAAHLRADAPVVSVDRAARDAALRHVAARQVEQGGLLVGEPFARGADDAVIALVHVRAAVPGEEATGDAISLRMEAAVWSAANAILRPGERVIGWFHSHPGIGAFFSETDRRTQAAFFAQAYSVGWVIDPLRGEEAWFVGPRSAPLPAPAVRSWSA